MGKNMFQDVLVIIPKLFLHMTISLPYTISVYKTNQHLLSPIHNVTNSKIFRTQQTGN